MSFTLANWTAHLPIRTLTATSQVDTPNKAVPTFAPNNQDIETSTDAALQGGAAHRQISPSSDDAAGRVFQGGKAEG